jgi:hypothetical protein
LAAAPFDGRLAAQAHGAPHRLPEVVDAEGNAAENAARQAAEADDLSAALFRRAT